MPNHGKKKKTKNKKTSKQGGSGGGGGAAQAPPPLMSSSGDVAAAEASLQQSVGRSDDGENETIMGNNNNNNNNYNGGQQGPHLNNNNNDQLLMISNKDKLRMALNECKFDRLKELYIEYSEYFDSLGGSSSMLGGSRQFSSLREMKVIKQEELKNFMDKLDIKDKKETEEEEGNHEDATTTEEEEEQQQRKQQEEYQEKKENLRRRMVNQIVTFLPVDKDHTSYRRSALRELQSMGGMKIVHVQAPGKKGFIYTIGFTSLTIQNHNTKGQSCCRRHKELLVQGTRMDSKHIVNTINNNYKQIKSQQSMGFDHGHTISDPNKGIVYLVEDPNTVHEAKVLKSTITLQTTRLYGIDGYDVLLITPVGKRLKKSTSYNTNTDKTRHVTREEALILAGGKDIDDYRSLAVSCGNGNCGKNEKDCTYHFKQCSKCHDEYYCSRKCQVEHYHNGGHKHVCGKSIEEQKRWALKELCGYAVADNMMMDTESGQIYFNEQAIDAIESNNNSNSTEQGEAGDEDGCGEDTEGEGNLKLNIMDFLKLSVSSNQEGEEEEE